MRLLVVDDESLVRDSLIRAFSANGFTTRGADSVGSALALAKSFAPEAAVVDLHLSDGTGLDLLMELRVRFPAIKVVVMSGYASIGSAVDSIRLGAVDFCCKPVSCQELILRLRGIRQAVPFVPMTLAQAHWEHIRRTLEASGNNISESARRLGLRRQSLQRMLQKRPPAPVR